MDDGEEDYSFPCTHGRAPIQAEPTECPECGEAVRPHLIEAVDTVEYRGNYIVMASDADDGARLHSLYHEELDRLELEGGSTTNTEGHAEVSELTGCDLEGIGWPRDADG